MAIDQRADQVADQRHVAAEADQRGGLGCAARVGAVVLVDGSEIAALELERGEIGVAVPVAEPARGLGDFGDAVAGAREAVPHRACAKVLDIAALFEVNVAEIAAERSELGRTGGQHVARIVTVAGGQAGGYARFAAGVAGLDADRARSGVAAKQRALRPAQHFDALHVGKVEDRAARRRDVDAIEIDRGLLVRAGDDAVAQRAADREDRQLRAADRGAHVDARRHARQIDDVGDAIGPERILAQRGDRDRNVLQRLLALLGGDDDDIETIGITRRLGRGHAGRSQHADEGAGCQ